MISYGEEKIRSFFEQSNKKYQGISALIESSIPNLQVFSGILGPEKSFLLQNLLKSVTTRSADLLVTEADSMHKIAIIRFLFESLVLARLIMREEAFAKKTYYSAFAQHYEKKKAIIEQIALEIDLLKAYILKEKNLELELDANLNSKSAEEAFHELHKKDDELVEDLLSELTAFSDDAAEWGFEEHLSSLETMHISYVNDINQLRTKMIEAIVKLGGKHNEEDSNDHLAGLLTKLSKDDRKWGRKASETDLIKEYNFIYRYSSGLLHGGTYAFFTPHTLTPEENIMLTRLGLKYLAAIVDSIRSASFIFNVKVIKN